MTQQYKIYDLNKKLNHTSDHGTMKGYDVVEIHLNAGGGVGTELLIKSGFSTDVLDKAILEASAKYFKNRGYKYRNDLYNMNTFASLGISYRLLEVCFIDSQTDMSTYDIYFDAYCEAIAQAIKDTYIKPVMLVAGHGNGDPGACTNNRQEAIEVRNIVQTVYNVLTKVEETYKIEYRAHVQGDGWLGWKKDGETAGTTGQSKRLEAIQIDPKGRKIKVTAHIQNKGTVDYGYITKDTIIGTVGQSLRLEALKLVCDDGSTIYYQLHLANDGWTAETKANDFITLGTVGKSKQTEAIRIRVE